MKRALKLCIVLLALMLPLAGCVKHEPEVKPLLPQSLNDRIEWPSRRSKDPEYQELLRHVVYADDGVTKIGVAVEYKNGKTAFEKFRPGKENEKVIQSVVISYPRVDGQTVRPKYRELELDVDGRTLLKDRIYSLEGKLLSAGDRESPDVYSSKFYRQDGSLEKRRRFDRVTSYSYWSVATVEWKVTEDDFFGPDSTLYKTIRQTYGMVEIKTFWPNGLPQSVRSINPSSTFMRTDVFETDGKTISKEIVQTGEEVNVESYVGGVVQQNVRVALRGQYVTVSLYTDGKRRLNQYWRPKNSEDLRTDGAIDLSKYKLSRVQYISPGWLDLKVIDFQDDGVTPQTITEHDPKNLSSSYPQTVKTFAQDGTLQNVRTYDEHGAVVSDVPHTAAENIRETIDPADMRILIVEKLPEVLVGNEAEFK